MRSVLFATTISLRILVLAPAYRLGESMSLYRAGLKLAFFLPLGVAMPLLKRAPSGFTDVSSVFQSVFTDRRDPLIEPPSASARLQDLRT